MAANINALDGSGFTKLFLAARDDNLAKVKQLIAAGANINKPNNVGSTPIFIASLKNNLEIVKELIAAGAEVDKANDLDNTALYVACELGNTEILKALIAGGADVNRQREDGVIPLYFASTLGNLEILKILIEAGADVDKTNNIGTTPLHAASELGFIEIVKELIKRGADINKQQNNGATSLYIACEKGQLEIVKELLKAGVDINKGNKNGRTPISFASKEGYLEIVKVLIAAGADINKPRNDGATPLLFASQEGHLEIVKGLIAAGADVKKGLNNGTSPLLFSAGKGKLEIVKELVAAGADINKENMDGATPIYVASHEGYLEIVKVLIAAGAHINKANNDGDSSLLVASRKGYLEIVKVLITAGANIDKQNNDGATSLLLASYNNRIEIVALLLEKGADINKIIWNGKSILQHAEAGTFKNQEIIDLILEKAGKGPKLWKGWSKSDAEKFNVIFNTEPDATGKILANDYACCPVCLKYIERSEACMYMKHKCPDLGGFYHKELYDKYKNADGFIGWCTICGRPARGHTHLELVPSNTPYPGGVKGGDGIVIQGDPFEKDCRLTNGGGGLPEKLARFRALRETAKLLQGEVDKIKEKQALEILVEETWNGPFTKKFLIPGIAAAKKWNINAANFPANVVEAAAPAEAPAANIPLPEGYSKVEEIEEHIDNIFGDEDEKGLLFKHKQPDGSVKEHKITYASLVSHLDIQTKEFGGDRFGRCFMYPDCKTFIYPNEIEGVVGKEGFEQALYDDYKNKFNKRFAEGFPVEGGRRKTKKAKKQKKQRGGGETPFFTEATNAQCVNPSFEGGRRKTKKVKNKKAKKYI